MIRKVASFAVVLLMTASAFAGLLPAAGGRAEAVLTVNKEWAGGPYNGTPSIITNDTDGDGRNELILYLDTFIWGPGVQQEEHWIKVYDLPGYTLAWSLELGGSFTLELVDAGQNGSVQLLLITTDDNGTRFELYSGKGFQKLWTSPYFTGSLIGQSVLDVDADGVLEMVFANGSMAGDKMNLSFEYRLQVFDLAAGKKEWESAALSDQVNDLRTANIDGDPAWELLVFLSRMDANLSSGTGLSVYDGSSHSLQWQRTPDMNLSSLYLIHTGDVDGDRVKELLLDAGWYDDINGSSAGFLLLSAADGSAEWTKAVPNASFSLQVADIDNDALPELLATESVTDEEWNTNTTFRIFDLKTHDEVWSMGPFESNVFGGSSSMSALDLTGDGTPEVLVTNSSFDLVNFTMSYSYLVIDGRSLRELWQSPSFQGYGGMPQALALDSDSVWELLVADSWTDSEGGYHGIIHVYSTDTWKQEWESDDYLAQVYAAGMDAINDSRPEILVMVGTYDMDNDTTTQKLLILHADTHAVLWSGPEVSEFTPAFVDIYGSPRNEIVLVLAEGEYPDDTTRLLVYNDTTLKEAWSSDKLEGHGYPQLQGDFDGDGRGELMMSTTKYNENRTSATMLSVFEFVEEPLKHVDLAIGEGDLSVSNATPLAGTKVTVSALVRNLGDAAAGCATVALALDGAQVDQTTVDVPAGGTVGVDFVWIARLGDHTLTVRLDPRNAIAEADETNNNASVSVSVGRPPRPVAVITSPVEGQQIPEGQSISFDGSSSFAPEGSTFFWVSEQDGFLGSAPVFNTTLPLGDHYVTLFLNDGQYNVSATVNFTVTPPPPPPGTTWAVITSPRNGAIFKAGEPIVFDGSRSVAAEPEYELSYEWSSNASGALGSSPQFTLALPSGSHNITLKVDDGHGGTSTASVSIRVREAPVVRAVISSPAEGQLFEVTQSVRFDGAASTGPAGTILSFKWSSNLSGPLGTQMVFSTRLSQGSHGIALSVSDGLGTFGNATVNITVRRSQDYRPVVTIAFPANGSTVSGTVTVNGTAWDDVSVAGVYIKIDNEAWGSVSGALNWFYHWNTNTTKYPNGAHTITVKATDGTQSSDEVRITVIVNNTNPPKPPVTPPDGKTDNTMLYIGIGLVVVFGAAGAAAFLMMRRK